MKAIMLPYVAYQNGPSRPENVLIDIPEDVSARDELLHKEWNNIFDDLEGEGEGIVVTTKSAYGDLEIGNGDCFIFFTYVNVNAGWNQ